MTYICTIHIRTSITPRDILFSPPPPAHKICIMMSPFLLLIDYTLS